MTRAVFIQANNKQLLGARVAEYCIRRHASDATLRVEIINVDRLGVFHDFAGATYKRNGRTIVHDPHDLQSFTLSRFMPPELCEFQGKAIVIDPDIFAMTDIGELFEHDMGEAAILCCPKRDAWDSSVMLLDCARLRHWRIGELLAALRNKTIDYTPLMTLRNENCSALPRDWNSLDHLTAATKMLHTTNRLTQPWKTGLRIDFTRHPLPKLFGIIPKEWLLRILGRYPARYQPHPNREIERCVLKLIAAALAAEVIDRAFVQEQIEQGCVRRDLLDVLPRAPTRDHA